MQTKPAQLMNSRRIPVSVFLIFLFSLVLDVDAQNFQRKVFKLDFSGVEQGALVTNSIIVPEGEVWEIVQFFGSTNSQLWKIDILIDGEEAGSLMGTGYLGEGTWSGDFFHDFAFSVKYPAPIIFGPATLNLVNAKATGASQAPVVLIYRVITESSPASTPSNTVVIPSDAAGPVEIMLESSLDLVTWTRAEPGEYGASTEKRFFRLRAVVKQ